MKIEVRRMKDDTSVVELVVDGIRGARSTWFVAFQNRCSGEFTADLFEAELKRRLEEDLRELRRKCYEAGFKDGRAKRAKLGWFSGSGDLERGAT